MLDKLFKKLKILKRKFKYKKKSYSFGGVDLLIDYIFKNKKKGFYVDIGCQHPISNNNTYLLFKKGWSGINIDLDQTNIDLFNIERPIDINICSALSSEEGIEKLYFFHNGSPINSLNQSISNLNNSKINKVTDIKVNILNNFLEKYQIKKIDFLNIDVEGHELNVLKGFDIDFFKPSVICVEFLDTSMNKMEFKNIKLDNILNSEIYKFLINHKYHLVNMNHSDLIFVHDEFRD